MDVKHIAKLARLGLTKKEEEKFEKELSSIFGFVEKLQEINVEKISPTANIAGTENIVRDDRGVARSKEEREKLLNLIPEKKDDYAKVKTIL